MSDMELVVIKTFLNRMDAELAKGALDANGIEALIRADDAGGTRPSLWTGGVELLVRADDVETASIVLGADSESLFVLEVMNMQSVTTTKLIGSLVFVSALVSATQAHAQIPIGNWQRTDAQGAGLSMTVEPCCSGGLRLTYHIPTMGNQPSDHDDCRFADEWDRRSSAHRRQAVWRAMAITRLDDHHYRGIVKMDGKTCWKHPARGLGGRQVDDRRDREPELARHEKDQRDEGRGSRQWK